MTLFFRKSLYCEKFKITHSRNFQINFSKDIFHSSFLLSRFYQFTKVYTKSFYKHLTSRKYLWLKYLNSYPIRKGNKPTCMSSQWKRRRTDEIEKSLRWTSNRFVTRRNKNEPLIKYYIIPKVCVRNKKKKNNYCDQTEAKQLNSRWYQKFRADLDIKIDVWREF